MSTEALWYKHAVIYQLHVRSFYDSVGDGIGDFHGLAQKLDYLQDLGVTAIWLLPFYPSPLRDDGYDIADYRDVNPQYGSLELFQEFLTAAHDRGLRVITELVINHTSDQHAWFQRARRAAPGSRERDFYVWSETPEKYRDARIIFKDFEVSNWTYDHLAKAYYFHRFYSHQPDLNFDNPAVLEAILPVLDFWLSMGVDGLRLDAVPYLIEREGTSCENLPETHAILKQIRQHVDTHYPNRMLLAEANQWPEDAVAYFGNGDECHMAFHFPVMPRLYMAIHREDRFPLIDIMDQTPAIPETCQWAMFLRNHDELTLEMVTDEERDYMYRAYAVDRRARINLGIRRRLAPLLGNNRRQIELMNGLLFSLPGTPIVYYGDEIGMGDNIYLGDRNGVRTPMQWSGDRNAGFSRANPQRLYLPVVTEAEYHYEAVNVEAQQNNPHSLLWWMKRLIDMRKRSRALTEGTLQFLMPTNRKVLAFLRRVGDEAVLVVANLSRFMQYVEIDLPEFTGRVPVEVFGGSQFPELTARSMVLTLGPHAFHWFQLIQPDPLRATVVMDDPQQLPLVRTRARWWDVGTRDEDGLESAMCGYLQRLPDVESDTSRILDVEIRDRWVLEQDDDAVLWLLVRYRRESGLQHEALVPLRRVSRVVGDDRDEARQENWIARTSEHAEHLLVDCTGSSQFAYSLAKRISQGKRMLLGHGHELVATSAAVMHPDLEAKDDLRCRPLVGDGGNRVLHLGAGLVIKIIRYPSGGTHPEQEFGEFFQRVGATVHRPAFLGALEIRQRGREPLALAVLQEFVPNEGDCWQYTLDHLSHYFNSAVTQEPGDANEAARPASESQRADSVASPIDEYLDFLQLLGKQTAELHRALASNPDVPAFAPESFSPQDQRSLYQSLRGLALEALDAVRRHRFQFSEADTPMVEEFLDGRDLLLRRFLELLEGRLETVRLRLHGDYHLAQVLRSGATLTIIDFEGNPQVPVSERRIKRPPLRDIASMLHSLDYAARVALAGLESTRGQAPGVVRPADFPKLQVFTDAWRRRCQWTFAKAYLTDEGVRRLLPQGPDRCQRLLEAYVLERTLQELLVRVRTGNTWRSVALASTLALLKDGIPNGLSDFVPTTYSIGPSPAVEG